MSEEDSKLKIISLNAATDLTGRVIASKGQDVLVAEEIGKHVITLYKTIYAALKESGEKNGEQD